MEFDPFDLSVKDLATRNVIIRSNSSGLVYTLRLSTRISSPQALTALASTSTWHCRLSHPGHDIISKLSSTTAIQCNKSHSDTLCHACQLGHNTRMPFHSSSSHTDRPSELIHCDLWTLPILSISGYKYYLVVLDDFTHYLWTFPLRLKYDTFTTLSNFFSYVSTQFGSTIKTIQCDNKREFDNSCTRSFLLTHGVLLRMSCPYTSLQNGKAKHIIYSINSVMCSLLFQASLLAAYWVKSLHTVTFLLNRLPTKTIRASCLYFALFGTTLTYEHLRVFGCACYPNMSATGPHNLAPLSACYVFLGYSDHHKGYHYLDLSTNRLMISRHVVFDEAVFPIAASPHPTDRLYFLLSEEALVVPPIGTPLLVGSIAPRAAMLELVPILLDSPPPTRHGFHSTVSGCTCGASGFPASCCPSDSCHTPCSPDDSSHTTCGPSASSRTTCCLGGSCRTLCGLGDSCLSGVASRSSPHGYGLLHQSPMSVVHIDLRIQQHSHF
jgi:hypothetical protein